MPDVVEAEGFTIKAPSPIALDGLPAPEGLTADDIEALVTDCTQAVTNAMEAGFDGVELHGANAYLHDQFVQDVSIQRADQCGDSIENRSRLPLRVLDALVSAVGSDRGRTAPLPVV